MASKLTALTEATVVDNANDFLLMTDVSDTTMAASGTTKKVNPDKLPISTAQAAVNADLATYDVPGKPPSLNVDGNLDAILTVRAGTSTELNAIVLNANELAIEKHATTSKPQALRGGDGTTAGGFYVGGNTTINLSFGSGAYPAYPTSTDNVAFTAIPGSELFTSPRGLTLSMFVQFNVPANCGLEFFWHPLLYTTIKIIGGPPGTVNYFSGEGLQNALFLPDTAPAGQYWLLSSWSSIVPNYPATAAQFRCKTIPGGSDVLSVQNFYAEFHKIPMATP